MGGFIKSAVSGVGKVLGVEGASPNAANYVNPYTKSERKEDLGRSNAYNKYGIGGLGSLNTEAAGYNPLIAHLHAMGEGKGPSLAQMQLKQATDRNISNQAGIAASNSAINPALAARLMGQNTAQLGQQAASDAGILRLQEQIAAMNAEMNARSGQGALTGNVAALGTGGAMNYQSMAEALAEQDRRAKMGLDTAENSAANANAGRRGEFWSKIASGAAGASGGGGASGFAKGFGGG